MKKYLVGILFCLFAAAGCSAYGPFGELTGGVYIGGQGEIGLDYFYDQLAPYGSWVEFSPYGYVWCPTDLGYGWRPYSNGHWVWTDDGWTWISDYDWGWIPFHYGRWDFDDGLGWFWVPDTVWGPAWVTWSWSDMYVGWAPLPPYAEFVAGVGIRGFGRPLPFNFWCFVEGSRFLDRDIRRDIFPFERNAGIFARAIHRENLGFQGQRIFNRGVGIDDVRHWTGRTVPQYRLEDARQPGGPRIAGDRIQMYRPPVLRSESARPRAFLPRTEAPQRLQDHQRQLLQEQSRRSANERAIRQNQDQQRRLLEQSQQRERQMLDQQRQQETRRTADQAARERANREYQQRQQDMQRQHQQERSQMQQRHEEERRSTQQSAPPRRKGKGKD
jgi:hypothetical protein